MQTVTNVRSFGLKSVQQQAAAVAPLQEMVRRNLSCRPPPPAQKPRPRSLGRGVNNLRAPTLGKSGPAGRGGGPAGEALPESHASTTFPPWPSTCTESFLNVPACVRSPTNIHRQSHHEPTPNLFSTSTRAIERSASICLMPRPRAALRRTATFLRHGPANTNHARSLRSSCVRAPHGVTAVRPRTPSLISSLGTNGPHCGAASLLRGVRRSSCAPQASHIRGHPRRCAHPNTTIGDHPPSSKITCLTPI